MKIADIKLFPVHPGWRKNLIFVKVTTDDGLYGWGEIYSQYDRDRVFCQMAEEMSRYLIGRDPFQVRHMQQFLYDDFAQRRASLEFWCAFSGIEQACWDIMGKACNQPVYNLLGGPVRDKIRVYANGWSYKMANADDYARAAEACVKSGFTAMKLDPIPRPWRTYIPHEHVKHAIGVMKIIREAVGPDVDLLLDIHRRLAPHHAIEMAEALAEFRPYWFEEPCPAENLTAMARIRNAISIPVVTGEAVHGKHGFRAVFEAQAADIINPDVANCGGILELTQIAAMAESHYVAVSPHNYNSTLSALSSTVHASAVMPNFIITEYFLPFVELGDELAKNQLKPENGYIPLPDTPGLGLEFDEAALLAKAAKPFPARTMPFPKDERGGV